MAASSTWGNIFPVFHQRTLRVGVEGERGRRKKRVGEREREGEGERERERKH